MNFFFSYIIRFLIRQNVPATIFLEIYSYNLYYIFYLYL